MGSFGDEIRGDPQAERKICLQNNLDPPQTKTWNVILTQILTFRGVTWES